MTVRKFRVEFNSDEKLVKKSLIINILFIVIIAAGYISPIQQELIKSIGFLALSGAITNWLVVWDGLLGALFVFA